MIDKEKQREYKRNYQKTHYEQIMQWRRRRNGEIKAEVLTHYGNGTLACVHCGFNDIKALSIDHMYVTGYPHRKETGHTGVYFYRWLIKQGYPDGYQTLCMNCQWIKRDDNREHRTRGNGARPPCVRARHTNRRGLIISSAVAVPNH